MEKKRGELLVQFQLEIGASEQERIVKGLGCAFKEEIVPQRIWVVLIPPGRALSEYLERFRRMPEVAYVEPNEDVELLEGGV